jgi:hypothetical protein
MIALGLVAVLLVGCGKKEASITDVTMSAAVDANDHPVQPTTVFPIDAKGFYCSFKLSGFPPGTILKAQWVYVVGEVEAEVGKNYAFEEQTGTIGGKDGYTSTVLELPNIPGYTWPKGEYKVVLSVDGQEKASGSFKVE